MRPKTSHRAALGRHFVKPRSAELVGPNGQARAAIDRAEAGLLNDINESDPIDLLDINIVFRKLRLAHPRAVVRPRKMNSPLLQ
jgi:hypothetical protein